MDAKLQPIYVRAIRGQCAGALRCCQDFEMSLQRMNELAKVDNTAELQEEFQRVWQSLQMFLTFAANISKFLWPQNPAAKSRADDLRQLLGVADNSPLSDRTARNHLEHIDERLDKWALDTAAQNYFGLVDGNIGPANKISPLPSKQFRLRDFDPRTLEFTFYDQAYELRPMIDAIAAIDQSAEKIINDSQFVFPN